MTSPPDLTTQPSPPATQFAPTTTVILRPSGRPLGAEPTVNPHLVIACPYPEDRHLGYGIVHVPTGWPLLRGWGGTLARCRAIVAALADLDWSEPDPDAYRPGGRLAHYGERLYAALADTIDTVRDQHTAWAAGGDAA